MSEPTNPNPAGNAGAAPMFNFGPSADPTLASPWIRLGAAIVDGIVLAPVNFLLSWLLIKFMTPGIGMMILLNVIMLAVFIGVNFTFLAKGQTIGKMLLKLQIQNRTDGSLLPVNDLILRRILPFWGAGLLLSAIFPLLGLIVLVDAFCIFRPARNTLHDDLANSKVVKLPG